MRGQRSVFYVIMAQGRQETTFFLLFIRQKGNTYDENKKIRIFHRRSPAASGNAFPFLLGGEKAGLVL
ncbi:MAG: hypothetical protein LUE16_11220 [Lachnospiraceae bacterium]|nr:hypothetical protein [Lachnospiraceae bacterium]